VWVVNTTQNIFLFSCYKKSLKITINYEFFSAIGYGWKKIDVKQKDKSHVGPQGKKTM
jgi:hypothetical protein